MIFSSVTYMVFLAIVLLVLRFAPSASFKRYFLLFASYVFYAWWDWRFVGLIGGVTVLNWAGARWMHGQSDRRAAKRVLTAVIVADLVVLGVFKYYGFFIETAGPAFQAIGLRIPALAIVLPISISFITFEVISYMVDVYRADLEPSPLYDVAMLVAFFPHLIAGPILRPRQFLPQLRRDITVTGPDLDRGVQLFTFGLVMKVLVADRLAPFADRVLTSSHLFSSATLWLGVFAYSVQIYMDFAGYSAMAIGSARCMGFSIPRNFDAPYSARNITVFWRRWHISLSTWLRTYLYIPLGGNRKGKIRQAANLMIVMLLAGLWHGASWNFVLWGGLHGFALVIHKVWTDNVAPSLKVPSVLSFAVSWSVTMLFVSLAWVFFRVSDLGAAIGILRRMFGFASGAGVGWMATSALLLVPTVYVANLLYVYWWHDRDLPLARIGTFRGAFFATFVLLALVLFWPTATTPFIYFQF